MNTRRRYIALLTALILPLSACSSSPDKLAKDLQAAFEKGDMDAALALANTEGAPADLHYFYLDQVNDCASAKTTCTASLAPLDDKFKADLAGLAEQGLEVAAAPEGIVLIEIKAADGQSSGKMRMPYAKVDGKYKLVSQRYTAAKLAEQRATTNQQLVDKLLAGGIYDSASRERRFDWKDTATALPADGGEIGIAFKKNSMALAAAVAANDPDAALHSGDGFAAMVFKDKDYDGKPIALSERKGKLRAQAARFLRDVEVKGGWLRGDEALLIVDAKNGIGWIERGAIFLTKQDNAWAKAGKETVSYPQ